MFIKQLLIINIIAGSLLLSSCATAKPIQKMENKDLTPARPQIPGLAKKDTSGTFLEGLMKQYPQYFESILKNQKDWNVQVIYTQVNRTENGLPELQNHYFNVDSSRYFYPASTVKLPIVLLALQRLNELKEKGIGKNTTMITESAYSGQTAVYNDPATPDGKPTIAQYIKKILMVSDNDAFNRLYEFLGQDYINTELHKKGYKDAQVLHRLNIFLTRL